jgi:hypothetical protein
MHGTPKALLTSWDKQTLDKSVSAVYNYCPYTFPATTGATNLFHLLPLKLINPKLGEPAMGFLVIPLMLEL